MLIQYITGHLIYKCGGIDKRTIEKFEKVCCRLSTIPHHQSLLLPLKNFGGGGAAPLCADDEIGLTSPPNINTNVTHECLEPHSNISQ
jgi:hypothetical protein